MGWGGRLVGACAVDVPKYIGIDLNTSLKKPYTDMIKMLKPLTDTKIDVRFKDALKVDYSKLDYDMVFTSPPYYNLEIYEGTVKKTKDDWDDQFYKPIFTKTWTHLKKGGHYCLNVPREVYERVCLDIFGKADELIPLVKAERKKVGEAKDPKKKYGEFIYVWRK
jgi:DNA modification methylase